MTLFVQSGLFIQTLCHDNFSKNQRQFTCQITENDGLDIRAYTIYLHTIILGVKNSLLYQKVKKLCHNFFPGNMQNRTIVSRFISHYSVYHPYVVDYLCAELFFWSLPPNSIALPEKAPQSLSMYLIPRNNHISIYLHLR